MNTKQLMDLILEYEPNQLIEAELLYLKAYEKYKIDRKIFNVYLARTTKHGYLERLQRGIYFRTIETKFGTTLPNLYKETITFYTQQNQGFFGYETMLVKLGLRNEMPRKLIIYTTNKKRIKYADKNITLKRFDAPLNEQNIKYYEILCLLSDLDVKTMNNVDLYKKLAQYIHKNGLIFEKFFDYMNNFSDKVLPHFIPLKKELNHEIA